MLVIYSGERGSGR
ncbi:hypothetical protein PatS [Nostoc punctiforme PCC 73102]|uniref:Uncharacterized protein n=1 Tax=Nostoc punctiforme (strain ATCC 29133 / PCC 73102) TaxID=63737 RepID=B2J4H8_NOSP7|nr:hypothetical protein PatS [Nostoc punctiforme PCC 73102]